MEELNGRFTVPAYYPRFSCKGSACRHPCCKGLTINISQEEYFRLLSMDCSKSLRRDLDVSLHIRKDASPVQYAQISPNFMGVCRMLDDDGLCRLQLEGGYDALTSVCKYFPRSPRSTYLPECSTTNACEETLEVLLKEAGAVELIQEDLHFDLAALPPKAGPEEAEARAALHLACVRHLQGSSLDLLSRLSLLASWLSGSDSLIQSQDWQGLLLFARDGVSGKSNHPTYPMEVISSLVSWCGRQHEEIADLADQIEKALQEGYDESQFQEDLQQTAERFPLLLPFVGRLMTNEVFYQYFPFEDQRLQPSEAGSALLCIGQMLLLGLVIGLKNNEDLTLTDPSAPGTAALIDRLAAFFRVCDLSPLYYNIQVLLRKS